MELKYCPHGHVFKHHPLCTTGSQDVQCTKERSEQERNVWQGRHADASALVEEERKAPYAQAETYFPSGKLIVDAGKACGTVSADATRGVRFF